MKEQYEDRRGRKSMAYVVIASAREFPQYVGKNLHQIAVMRKLSGEAELLRDAAADTATVTMEDQYRAAIDIWSNGGASCVFHSMDEDNVASIMRHPLVGIASDSGVRKFNEGQPHPRGYGTNARVLGRYVREKKLITLEEAIRKMTSMPATAFRLYDRGRIASGLAGDVVVFDPETVIDKATFEQPHAYSEGFDVVIVNGQVVFRNGAMTGVLPGRPIYGPGRVAR
jgi:N-acyl-D-amino-acid deacylase